MSVQSAKTVDDYAHDLHVAYGLLKAALHNACPGPHTFRQHRDRRPRWCEACAFIGGITYACEALDLLMDQRARDSADLGATLAATIIRGDAAAIRKWLEQELAYKLPQDGVPPM